MTIDTFTEDIISLDAAAKHVSKISGKKCNRRILIRWSNRGVAGITLPTIVLSGQLFTSKQKLNWFLNESRAAKRRRKSTEASVGIRKIKQIENEAEQLGI